MYKACKLKLSLSLSFLYVESSVVDTFVRKTVMWSALLKDKGRDLGEYLLYWVNILKCFGCKCKFVFLILLVSLYIYNLFCLWLPS